MRRLLRLLAAYVRRQLLQWLAWRGFVVTLTLNQAVAPLLGLAVWSAALPGRAGLSTYYLALLVVQLMTVSYEQHTLANGIYAGALSDVLLQPRPAVVSTLAENFALRVWHLLFGLPIIAAAALVAGASPEPGPALLAVPALALAAGLRFLFTYLLALSAFWTQQAHGLVGFGGTLLFLLGGAAAPVPLLPDELRPLARALPFRSMLGFPAELASGGLGGGEVLTGYAWQLLWTAVFAVAAALLWRAGVRRYTAVGG
jgi:ABC-2 type transport system permease protein